jgi:hypothetical protein
MTEIIHSSDPQSTYQAVTDKVIALLREKVELHVSLPYGSDAEGFFQCINLSLEKLPPQLANGFTGYQAEEIVSVNKSLDIHLKTAIKKNLSNQRIIFIEPNQNNTQDYLDQMKKYRIDVTISGVNENATMLGLTEIPNEDIWFRPIVEVYGSDWQEKLRRHLSLSSSADLPTHLISLGKKAALDAQYLFLMVHGEKKKHILEAIKQKDQSTVIGKILTLREERGKVNIIWTDLS